MSETDDQVDISSIENLIDRKTKREEGIFFTAPHVVEEICGRFDFSQIGSVVDTAAGSCNFLLPLARRFPEKEFYAVERNPAVFAALESAVASVDNLHCFRGDILLDEFPIPPCDLYLGNPPFVNYTDLPEPYRDRIKPLWTGYMPVRKGFSLLLGESRSDVAALVFYHSVHSYLRAGGLFGVILPNSLVKGNRASESFREFRGITVDRIVDIPHADAFLHTSRACFYIMGKKGGETSYPLPYEKEGGEGFLIKKNGLLIEEDLVLEKGSDYPIRQGINTLGANKIFFFDEKPDLEDDLVHPLLRSGDVGENRALPSRWVLLPYLSSGELLDEKTLAADYPRTWKYLVASKRKLEKRKSRFARKNWYALFGIGPYTFAPYKVVWRAMGAKRLEAAVTSDAIPNQAMHGYIACESPGEADYLCNLLNSEEIRRMAALLSETRSRSFAQPGTMKLLPLKKYGGDRPTGE